jgi:hypothetical protein
MRTASIPERTAKSRTVHEKTARGKDEGEGMKDECGRWVGGGGNQGW